MQSIGKIKHGPAPSSGFSFVECLIALLVLSLMLHAGASCWQHYQQLTDIQRQDHTVEWHNFVILLEQELTQFYPIRVQTHRLIIQPKAQPNQRAEIIQKQQKIYKSPGFQPYLYDVAAWQLSYTEPFLTIHLTFTNQQQFDTTLYWPRQVTPE